MVNTSKYLLNEQAVLRTINITVSQDKFIKEHIPNFSQFVRDKIDEEMRRQHTKKKGKIATIIEYMSGYLYITKENDGKWYLVIEKKDGKDEKIAEVNER